MRVKTIVDEDFVNYSKPSMFIGTISCGGKCCLEGGFPLSVCQNDGWRGNAPINILDEVIVKRYLQNQITQAIVLGGLEPMEQSDDDVVIYTGYYPAEVTAIIDELQKYDNIIVKFGRYIPNTKSCFDKELGVTLASDNQYAVRIS